MNYEVLIEANRRDEINRVVARIVEYGAHELNLDKERDLDVMKILISKGWNVYHEDFDEEGTWCLPLTGNTEDGFSLSGSKSSRLSVVYDPHRWAVV